MWRVRRKPCPSSTTVYTPHDETPLFSLLARKNLISYSLRRSFPIWSRNLHFTSCRAILTKLLPKISSMIFHEIFLLFVNSHLKGFKVFQERKQWKSFSSRVLTTGRSAINHCLAAPPEEWQPEKKRLAELECEASLSHDVPSSSFSYHSHHRNHLIIIVVNAVVRADLLAYLCLRRELSSSKPLIAWNRPEFIERVWRGKEHQHALTVCPGWAWVGMAREGRKGRAGGS